MSVNVWLDTLGEIQESAQAGPTGTEYVLLGSVVNEANNDSEFYITGKMTIPWLMLN